MKGCECAYRAENGICQSEKAEQQKHRQTVCHGRYSLYARESDVRRRHDAAAYDRELTDITAELVHRWREEGLTVLQIAMLLDRSCAAITEILEVEDDED